MTRAAHRADAGTRSISTRSDGARSDGTRATGDPAGVGRQAYGGVDAGSTIPLVLLCFLVAAFLVAGTTASSAAFLAQRDLQADCDGAAVAAADGADLAALYAGNAADRDLLPVAVGQAQQAAEEHASAEDPPASVAVSVAADDGTVTVACGRVVRVPFGGLFGLGNGLERTTTSTARSPLVD